MTINQLNALLKTVLRFSLLLLSPLLFSQTIKGKVYDESTTVKGALVVNLSENIMTYTDEEGDFKIAAKVSDSIYVSSLFHTKVTKVLTQMDFEHIVVIEVVKTVNALDEVYLEKINEKKFDSITTNKQLQSQIAADIKNNPHLYSPASGGGIDIIAVAKLIGSLFKSKERRQAEKEIEVETVKHSELESFFQEDEFFNEKFLVFDLQILPKYQPLFFDYCDAQGIEKELLKKEHRFLLVDALVRYSQEFRKALKETPPIED